MLDLNINTLTRTYIIVAPLITPKQSPRNQNLNPHQMVEVKVHQEAVKGKKHHRQRNLHQFQNFSFTTSRLHNHTTQRAAANNKNNNYSWLYNKVNKLSRIIYNSLKLWW